MTSFNLTQEDYFYKIPVIKKAMELNGDLNLFASAGSAPTWMLNWLQYLKKDYYEVWANYLKFFLDAYQENGIDFWGLSTGYEPIGGSQDNHLKWNPNDMVRSVLYLVVQIV